MPPVWDLPSLDKPANCRASRARQLFSGDAIGSFTPTTVNSSHFDGDVALPCANSISSTHSAHQLLEVPVLSYIPLWVPVLFLFLVAFGWFQAQDRLVHPRSALILAISMVGMSLAGLLAGFGPDPWAVLAWLAGFSGSMTIGQALFAPRRMRASEDGKRIYLPGSWQPFALMMAIFTVRFVLGFAQGVDSPLLATAGFAVAIGSALGCLSGGFAARALALAWFGRQRQADQSILIEKDSAAFQVGKLA